MLCSFNQAKTESMLMSYIKWQHCYPGYLLGACLAQLDRAKMFASFLDLGYCKAVCHLKICHEMYIHFDNIWVLSHASSSAPELLHVLPCPIFAHGHKKSVNLRCLLETSTLPPPSPQKKTLLSNALQIVLMQKKRNFQHYSRWNLHTHEFRDVNWHVILCI